MKRSKLFSIIGVASAVTLLAGYWYSGRTDDPITDIPPVLDASGAEVPGSFASLEQVTLGGVDQWILIRAQDTTKPVLLILHGGPGGAQLPWVDIFQPAALEENFIVVQWDQRGAGKSFDPDLTADDLQAEDFVADTFELTDLLRTRFGQDKIFLHGHSWGSALGFLVIAQDSTPFHAYIPAGERVNWVQSHTNSLAWVKEQAIAVNNTDFLKRIEELGTFEATNREHLEVVYEGQDVFRGGDIYTEGLWDQMLDYVFSGQSPYYTMTELNYYIPGLEKSGEAIAEFAYSYNLPDILTSATIPVHFMVGEHDHNTAADLSFEFYEALDAPAKSFTIIDGAGHSFLYEKPDEWAANLIRVADETLGN